MSATTSRSRTPSASTGGPGLSCSCRPGSADLVPPLVLVRRRPLTRWLADLPAVAERVIDPAHLPAMLFAHGADLGGSSGHRSVEHRPRIIDDQEHSRRCAANSLWAEVPVRWRLVLDPEQRVPDRELRDHLIEIIGAAESEHLDCPEGNLLEVHGRPTVPHGELGLDVRLHGASGSRSWTRRRQSTQRRAASVSVPSPASSARSADCQ